MFKVASWRGVRGVQEREVEMVGSSYQPQTNFNNLTILANTPIFDNLQIGFGNSQICFDCLQTCFNIRTGLGTL